MSPVEHRYVEPGYLEPNWISLGFALFFSVIYYGLSETRLSRTPRFSLFLAQIDPGYGQTLLRSEEILVNIILEVRQSTSWQDVLKADKCIDVFMVTKAKSNWLDWPLVNFRDQTITPEIWRQLRCLNPRYLELFFDTLESSR